MAGVLVHICNKLKYLGSIMQNNRIINVNVNHRIKT